MQSKVELLTLLKRDRPDLPEEVHLLWISYLEQLPDCTLASAVSQELDPDRWLAERHAGIGGSDVAAVLGESPWKSPRDIWMDKTGQLAAEAYHQSEAARWGNVLEETIANEWAQREKKKIVRMPVQLRSNKYKWLVANIDGFVVDDNDMITDVLEIKTTSAFNSQMWEEGPLPYYYMCQTTTYQLVTGIRGYYIVCLVGGQKLCAYHFPYDTDLAERIIKETHDFWFTNVQQLVEPKVVASDTNTLKQKLLDADETPPVIFDDLETNRVVDQYVILREKVKQLDALKKALYAEILHSMGDHKNAVTHNYTLTFQTSGRRTCDFDALQEKYPQVYEECVGISTSGKLNIK